MSVNQGVTMALSAVSTTLLFLLASCAAKQNCSEAHCKLLPLTKDVASKFQLLTTSEKGVRMIYLQLKIGNDSYDPLQAPNEFLPYRWVWAPTISELLLSLSYDYDILSLGLLKRQVRSMDMKLEDEPSGCLASLNSSCQDIVVARTLLGNVTARNGPGASIHSSEDVVCVAEIDKNINFFENFFEGDVEFRCCKVVDNQGGLNLIPECDLRVQKSHWYKAFYVVLNVLTLFVGLYYPVILFMLPAADYIFGFGKECEKEHQQEEGERLEQNGYLSIPSSQETREENSNVTEDNANVIEQHEHDKGKDEVEKRKIDEIPVDDGSPVNISTLLYACVSAKVFQHYSTKLPFNIKLAFLWVCVIPFPFYIELALGCILKDEYLEEIRKKDGVLLTGGLFLIFDITQTGDCVILIISYLIIPLLTILILTSEDLFGVKSKVKSSSSRVFIGDEVLQHFKKSKKSLLVILSLGKVPIRVYQEVQNSYDKFKKTGGGRLVRLVWVLLALISSILAVIWSVITAAICLLLIVSLSTVVLVGLSPYVIILQFFIRYKLVRSPRLRILFLILLLAGIVTLCFPDKHLLYIINPAIWLLLAVTAPFYLPFTSCRFVIKMCGYTIMGLIYNAEIAAPIAVFFATLASYLRDRYFDSKTKCKRVKEIISQEWQQQMKQSLQTEVVSDAIPKKLFWYVCDGVKYQVFPLEWEALRLLRDVTIIFVTAFLALCAIFFSSNSYKISTVASTIAVFVSAKIPMVLLREKDNFNGWEKINIKGIIRESVKKYIADKERLKPANEATV